MREKHYCTLSERSILESALPKLHPSTSKWRRYIREVRKILLISEHNPRTKARFRSRESVFTEAKRHLKESKVTMHPFSLLAMYKDIVMLITWYVYFFTATLYMTLHWESRVNCARYILYALKPILGVHIVMSFFMGFYNESGDYVEVRPKAIAINYLCGFFILDLSLFICPEVGHIYPDLFVYEGILHLLIFFHIPSVTKCLRVITLLLDLGNSVHELTSLVSTSLMLIHFFSVLICCYPEFRTGFHTMSNTSWVMLAGVPPKSNICGFRKYLVCLHKVCAMFLGPCSGMWNVRDLDEIIIFIIIILTGMFYMAYVTALVLQMSLSIRSSGNLYKHIIYQLTYYCRVKKLPDTITKRVNTLSQHLQLELKLHNCRKILRSTWLFQSLAPSVVGRIIMQLETLIVLPNDLIKDHKSPDYIFFITSGEVAIYTKDGMELLHICDGDYFGEISVLSNLNLLESSEVNKSLSYVAVYITELLVMRKETFKHHVIQHPEALHQIIERAKIRNLLNQERIHKFNVKTKGVSRKVLSRALKRRASTAVYNYS
nr:potassium/sodium hyperpolarization-activated cyclic nucleotide-gated channel 1-like [Onthophagus taurus]